MKDPLAERFKTMRKSLGMTQQEFADFLGINRGYVSVIETDRVDRLSEPLLNLIELKTGFSKEWVRTGTGPEGDVDRKRRIDAPERTVRSEAIPPDPRSAPESDMFMKAGKAPDVLRTMAETPKRKARPIGMPAPAVFGPGVTPSAAPAKPREPVDPSALLEEDDDIHAHVESILTHYRETADLSFLREVITGLWKQKKGWKARALKAEETLGEVRSALKGKEK